MADESKPSQESESTPPEPKATSPTPPPKSAPAPAAPAAAKPAAPAPKAPPALQIPVDNEWVQRYRARFGSAILEALEDRKQPYLVIDVSQLSEIARYSRDEEKFDLLEDYTAVDWPRREKRFDLVAILYSFPNNTRLRLKAAVAANERPKSLVDIWPTADWLEREIFDMFGVEFTGHPGLKRILLPDGWNGHPLRKDYDILQQDTAWVRENLGIESGQ
ncbi:MAG TPA: NADH-quinone oxidoreductase subunit C [Verrucomicrobiae bacterium]|jgi:NADH-quinone oxidoreductase subunit C|nr:NADH-quinone oxidoreductase subunit C [Verrucomicrobiae bacterium]